MVDTTTVQESISKGSHYKKYTIVGTDIGQPLDPAFIAEHYNLTPMMFTALKKVLRCGTGDKSAEQDLKDIIGACKREQEILKYRKG